jgi:hypothetical protein
MNNPVLNMAFFVTRNELFDFCYAGLLKMPSFDLAIRTTYSG